MGPSLLGCSAPPFDTRRGCAVNCIYDTASDRFLYSGECTRGILRELATDAEFLDDGTIALNVHLDQIVKHTTTLTNQHLQRTLCGEVFLVLTQVLRQVGDAKCEQCNLAFGATRVLAGLAILLEEFRFLS